MSRVPIISALEAKDAPAMSVLHAKAFNPAWKTKDMAIHVQKDIVFGVNIDADRGEDATDGGQLGGFIIAAATSDQAEILTLIISPDKRRKGLARGLLEAAERAAEKRGAEMMFLEVAEDNSAALSLYRRAGYEAFSRRPAYYRRENGRVAALNFRKKLDVTLA